MENLLTVKEVARIFRVKPITIYRWVEKKKIPAIVIGGQQRKTIRFKKEIIDQIVGEDNGKHDRG